MNLDLAISSKDVCVGVNFEINLGSLNADLEARSKSNSQRVTGEEPADENGFGASTTRTSSLSDTSHTDSGINNF